MNRKLRPFHDFDRLTPAQLERVHQNLADSTFQKTRVFLREEFGIQISYGRLRRYYHRWQETLQIKAQVGVTLTVSDYLKLQNGEAIPFHAVAHHLIQMAACRQAAAEDNTPARLLTLQRIASHHFNCELATAKNELATRRQNLREKLQAHKIWIDTEKLNRSQTAQPSNICLMPANFSMASEPPAFLSL